MPAPSLSPSSLRPAGRLRRWAPLALGIALGLGSATSARAQSLLELYESARAYDATYLSAKALAESQQYVLAQSRALLRPTASASLSTGRSLEDPPESSRTTAGSSNVNIAAKQPLFNRVS